MKTYHKNKVQTKSQRACDLNSQRDTKKVNVDKLLESGKVKEKMLIIKLLKYERIVENLYNEYNSLVDWILYYESIIKKCKNELKSHYENELLNTITKLKNKSKRIDEITAKINKEAVVFGQVIFNSKFLKGGEF